MLCCSRTAPEQARSLWKNGIQVEEEEAATLWTDSGWRPEFSIRLQRHQGATTFASVIHVLILKDQCVQFYLRLFFFLESLSWRMTS